MKAWRVEDGRNESGFATVVFAETRGQAKEMARHTDACMDADFCEIRATRAPEIDKYYVDGKHEMDWFNSADRIALAKELGWSCLEPYDDECRICPAKEFCDYYADNINEQEDE